MKHRIKKPNCRIFSRKNQNFKRCDDSTFTNLIYTISVVVSQPYTIGKKVSEWFSIQKEREERKTSSEEKRSTLKLWKNSRNKGLRRTVIYVIHLFNMHGYNNPKQLRFLSCKLKKKEINRKWNCSGTSFVHLSS